MAGTIEKMLEMLKDYLVVDFEEAYPEVRFRDKNNLIQTMKDVFSYTKCPFVILIDEWDCLFREYQQDQEAQKKYLDFLRAWLKDKDYVALAYMTGILPIKKYSTGSALNMFDEYTFLKDRIFDEYFGFTQDDIDKMLQDADIDAYAAEVKEWYDGYHFGETDV